MRTTSLHFIEHNYVVHPENTSRISISDRGNNLYYVAVSDYNKENNQWWHRSGSARSARSMHEALKQKDEMLEFYFNDEVKPPQPIRQTIKDLLPIKPKIVCLCGSTRFMKQFHEQNERLTLEGKIVLTVGVNVFSDKTIAISDKKKELDELHKRKIDLADEVFIINVGGYIGESTKSEINYAYQNQKPITYLEPV